MLLKMQVRLLLTISLIWQKALSSSYVCSSCRNPLPQSSSNIVFDRIHSQARTCEETLQSFLAETSKFNGALGPSAANGWHHGSRKKIQWALWSPVPKLRAKLSKQLSNLKLEMRVIDQCISQ
jgi:hypothetical protein